MFLKRELYSYILLLFVDAEEDGKSPHKLRTPPLHVWCSLCMHNLLQTAETSVSSKTPPRQMESTVVWPPEECIVRLHSSFPAEQCHCLLSIPHPSHRKEWAAINRKWDFCHPYLILARLSVKQGTHIENTYEMVINTLHSPSCLVEGRIFLFWGLGHKECSVYSNCFPVLQVQ